MAQQLKIRRLAPSQSIKKPPGQRWRQRAKRVKQLIFCILFIISVAFISLTLINYHNSLNWNNNKNSLKMAQMSPDMLQDSPTQIAIKEDFLKRANAMMDADGSIHVTQTKLKELKHDLDQIKTAKPQYQDRYQKIADKYSIQIALHSLFDKPKVVTANIDKIHKTMNTIGPVLNDIHQKYPHDKFVSDQMIIIHNLSHDLKLIKATASNTANLVVIRKQTAVFKPKVVYTDYQKAINSEQNLIYDWRILEPFMKLQPEIKTILNQQEHKIDLYNAYQKDLRDKDKAYEDLKKARATHAANNAQVIEQIRQEKIQKEQEQRAAEEEKRKEAEAAKEAEKDKDSNTNDHTNDTNTNKGGTTNSQHPKQNNKSKTKPNKKPKDHYIDPDEDNSTDSTQSNN